jgi:hypothetical protein
MTHGGPPRFEPPAQLIGRPVVDFHREDQGPLAAPFVIMEDAGRLVSASNAYGPIVAAVQPLTQLPAE